MAVPLKSDANGNLSTRRFGPVAYPLAVELVPAVYVYRPAVKSPTSDALPLDAKENLSILLVVIKPPEL